MAFDAVNGVLAFLESGVRRIRQAIGEAGSLAEQRANTIMYNLSALLEDIQRSLELAKCVVEAEDSREPLARFCTTWQLLIYDSHIVLTRVKPATTISYDGRAVRFHRDVVALEYNGRTVKLCKWSYCKEVDPADRRRVMEELPQLTYLAREVGNRVVKSYNALYTCARRTAPDCTR